MRGRGRGHGRSRLRGYVRPVPCRQLFININIYIYIYIYTSGLLSIPSTCQFCVLAVALQDAVRPGVRRKSFRQCSSVMKQSCCARQFVLAFFMSTLYLQLVRASTWRSLGDHLAITWSNNWSSLGVHLEATWRPLGGQVAAHFGCLEAKLELRRPSYAAWTVNLASRQPK